jgi:HAE1 family hydrophobic/amphiphilic exporter-1
VVLASALVTVKPVSGTELTTRYNLLRSVEISGSAAPGYSSAQAMKKTLHSKVFLRATAGP